MSRRETRRRRVRPAAAVAVAVLLTGACGTAPADDDGRPLVLTTFTVLADIARNVAGEDLRVESITTVGAEIHGYEPTSGDVRRAAGADLVLDNGLGLEAWFERFVQDADASRVVVSEGVETIPIADGADAGAANPHAWMSPLNALVYVDNIAAAFAELDPDNATAYAERAEAYQSEIQAVHDDLTVTLERLPEGQRALVTCEGAFSYLARDAGLEEVYLWPVNAEGQVTPRQITGAIEYVQDHEVPAVFCESTVSDGPMRQVVDAAGARFGGVLYVDSLSEPDGPVPTYLDLIRYDADLIATGLTGAGTP